MADGEKRITRSQSTSSTSSSWLGLGDYFPYGREARIARSPQNSPISSPAHVQTGQQTFFPSPESNSLPPINQQRSRSPRLLLNNNNMTQEGDTLATLSTALSGLQVSSRKPELPPFDKNAIEKWIRRVESAYIRSGISSPLEKFAFIESKFPVDEDPAVDEFLFGDPTSENWTAFCDYLRKRYGKTTRQKVAAILDPMHMDGRTPSQYYAKLKQSYDNITLDDIVKEICIRQLPTDLQQTICKDTESMAAKDMMAFADKFYNPDGSRLHKKPASVNVIKTAPMQQQQQQQQPHTPAFEDDDGSQASGGEINAVRGRGNFQNNRQGGYNNARSKSRGRSFGGGGGYGNNNNGGRFGNNNNGGFSNNGGFNNNGGGNRNNNNNRQKQNDPSLCFYHNKFGDQAERCDIGCAKSKAGNGQAPRQ